MAHRGAWRYAAAAVLAVGLLGGMRAAGPGHGAANAPEPARPAPPATGAALQTAASGTPAGGLAPAGGVTPAGAVPGQARPAPALTAVDGAIPVLEYHGLGAKEGRWTRTPADLRLDLATLYKEGFRPIDLDQLGLRPLPVPPGTHPIVLTFDDGLPSEFAWSSTAPATPSADSAAGILWRFHQSHPDWAFAATFFINAHPFGADSAAKLAWLVAHGAEIGNHTYDHADLATLDPAQRQAEIGRLQAYLAGVLPGYAVHSFAYPYGAIGATAVASGSWHGVSWNFEYLALVGASPLPAQPSGPGPFAVPRIQVAAPDTVAPSTRRFIWWGWQRFWLPTAHLYTAPASPGPATAPSPAIAA